jgi:hypothetical protein
MLRPHHVILLVSLLADGGIVPAQPNAASPDAGTASLQAGSQGADAGTVAPKPGASQSIPWPEKELQPLATLDGPAILAAHAALQQAMEHFTKEQRRACAFSPRSLELVIGYDAGWYFVRVNRRVDKCPGFGPGVVLEFDWFELYAVSPEGRVERYPYYP